MKMSAVNEQNDHSGGDAGGRGMSHQRLPLLTPSFPLASKETGRVVTHVVSPEPHRGWHSRGYLPHWDHPGMIQSLNFRLGDAMPQEVLDRWKNELGLVNPLGAPASRRPVEADGTAAIQDKQAGETPSPPVSDSAKSNYTAEPRSISMPDTAPAGCDSRRWPRSWKVRCATSMGNATGCSRGA
jgi:hypothetical protein